MIKKIFYSIFLTFFITNLSHADSYKEFIDNKTKNFKTNGEIKSNGIEISFDYPYSWEGKYSNYPNTLYQVTSDKGKGFDLCNIIIRNLPNEIANQINESNSNDLFDDDTLRSFVPRNHEFISSKKTKIDGQPAGVVETYAERENAGIRVNSRQISYFIYFNRNLISFTCMNHGEDRIHAERNYLKLSTLFQLMANSIIIHNKWKR